MRVRPAKPYEDQHLGSAAQMNQFGRLFIFGDGFEFLSAQTSLAKGRAQITPNERFFFGIPRPQAERGSEVFSSGFEMPVL